MPLSTGNYDIIGDFGSNGFWKYTNNCWQQISTWDVESYLVSDTTHRIESKTLTTPDSSGNIYYHYLNENWNSQGYGRMDQSRRQSALNSELSYRYIYDDATGSLKDTKAYSDANCTLLIPKTFQDFIDVNFDYFASGSHVVDPVSGYPFEGYDRLYTQPTAIGFYAELLANIITGDIVVAEMSRDQAIAVLNKMMTSLLSDQSRLGYKGLMPWISFNGTSWKRDPSALYENQVAMGDNANLSAALGAAEGALMDPSLSGNADVTAIRQKMEAFLEAQRVGYNSLYDTSTKLFRNGFIIASGSYMGGEHNYLVDEFRSGILFVTLRYDIDSTLTMNGYQGLSAQIKPYTTLTGETLYMVAPYGGGAFQMLWPTLTMPEVDNPVMKAMLEDFLTIAFDYSKRNNLPGFLSACYIDTGNYKGNVGIPNISVDTNLITYVASLYTLGAAHMIDPLATEAFLRDIFVAHPDLVTTHGLLEGYNNSTGSVVREQVSSNISTFLIGMAGKAPEYMTRYLQSNNLYQNMLNIYSKQNLYPKQGSALNLPVNQGISFEYNGGKYTYYSLNSVNVYGRRLRLRYSSTTDLGNCSLELKKKNGNTPQTIFSISSIHLVNTQGQVQEIIVDLPASPTSLSSIDEVVFGLVSKDPRTVLTSIDFI